MRCPLCGTDSPLTDRSRRRRTAVADSILREHRCPNCRHIFVTEQRVLSHRRAEELLDRHEDGSSRMLGEKA